MSGKGAIPRRQVVCGIGSGLAMIAAGAGSAESGPSARLRTPPAGPGPGAPEDRPHLTRPHRRIDGRAKVTGAATYASDVHPPGRAHAALATSTIPRGRIVRFEPDLEGAAGRARHLHASRLRRRDPARLRLTAGMLAAPDVRAEPLGDVVARTGSDSVTTLAEFVPAGGSAKDHDALLAGRLALSSGNAAALSWAFGAQFAEVRVHAETGEIRVARLTGAFAAGRVLNPLTARSQLTGGMIWGLGSALLEETMLDAGHYRNGDLAEYLVPTAADAPDLEALFVPDEDRQANPLGLKGLGELGIIGVNAAIANAVFDTTGRRIRRLPIRIDAFV